MHVLHSLKNSGLIFELKGGTSLSKGYQIIDRFSEDIDIHISPPAQFKEATGLTINENYKSSNKNHFEPRRQFFDWLADNIKLTESPKFCGTLLLMNPETTGAEVSG